MRNYAKTPNRTLITWQQDKRKECGDLLFHFTIHFIMTETRSKSRVLPLIFIMKRLCKEDDGSDAPQM